jgi:transposase
VLLVAHGMTCPEAAALFGDAPRTVEYWIRGFEQKGLAALREGERSGRPGRLSWAFDLIPAAQETGACSRGVIHRPPWRRLRYSMQLKPEDWACHSRRCYSLERFFKQAALCRASDRFARNPALNWLASNQLVCVRTIK